MKAPDLFIVSDNIRKEEAYFAGRTGQLRRVVHGVYITPEADFREVFQVYGLRLARKFFPNAPLCHVTARYRRPVGPIGEPGDRVFVGGDYPYKKILNIDGFEARIVQSMVRPDCNDARLYQRITVSDPIGSFRMWCATPELMLLQLMDSTKKNQEKHLSDTEMREIWNEVKQRHGGRAHAWDVMEQVAKASGKMNEADRFFREYYRDDD